jgi:transporter family protein
MNNWLVWSLLSALFAGATAVLSKIGVTGVDSNFATAIRTTVILVFIRVVA